jgi:RIO-like serine/threonine protein kinase
MLHVVEMHSRGGYLGPRIESWIRVQTDQWAIREYRQLQRVFKVGTKLPDPTHTSSNHPPSGFDEYT